MSYLHNPSWAWNVPYAEYRAECNSKHLLRERWELEFYKANPFDFTPATKALVAALYEYAQNHEFHGEASVRAMFTEVAATLTPRLHVEITEENVVDKFTEMRQEFYYFREFLDFPGIRLEDDKKHVHVDRSYFHDLGSKKECWLYTSFRLFGFSYYVELRYIIIQKKIGGPPEHCAVYDWYYIKGRNSDVGEEVIVIDDNIASAD